MDHSAGQPSIEASEKVARGLAGKKIVYAVYGCSCLQLDFDDGTGVRVERIFGSPNLAIVKTRQKKKIGKK